MAEFTYDALGRRIEKYDAIADARTRYYYDGQRVLLETDVDGSETDTQYYVYGNYIDEVLVMVDIAEEDDYYYAHDHLYSAVVLFDASGDVVERYEYDAYGKATVWNAGLTTTYSASQVGNHILFTGREVNRFDNNNLTIQYNRNRYLSQYMGRWFTCDPLGINSADGKENPFRAIGQYKDGMNIYEYVKSCSLILADPQGLTWWGQGWFPPPNVARFCALQQYYLMQQKDESCCELRPEGYIWQHIQDYGIFRQKVGIPGPTPDGKGGCIEWEHKFRIPIEDSQFWFDFGEPKVCECDFLRIYNYRKWCKGKPTGKTEQHACILAESVEGKVLRSKRLFGWIKYDYSCKCETTPDGLPINPPEWQEPSRW